MESTKRCIMAQRQRRRKSYWARLQWRRWWWWWLWWPAGKFLPWQKPTMVMMLKNMMIRGWARFCYSSGILDSRCFRGISWMHTFFWINWGIVRPVQPVFLILCWSWTESLQHEKGNIWNKCTSSYLILLVKLFNTNKFIQESESNCKDAKHLNQETKYFIR